MQGQPRRAEANADEDECSPSSYAERIAACSDAMISAKLAVRL
jgi:hypothetical protein